MRKYYSQRIGNQPISDIRNLRSLILAIYQDFKTKGYFQKYFGYWCVDQDYVSGEAGENLDNFFLLKLRKTKLYPIEEYMYQYEEDDIFDVIELLYDCCAKPIPQDSDYHSYSACGYHYSFFNEGAGKNEFRSELNSILIDYKDGFELSEEGEILLSTESEFKTLLEADSSITGNDQQKYEKAILKYRASRLDLQERLIAVRELADILENIRPKLKEILNNKDESDLFELANRFGIRHHNQNQQTQYDKKIWCSWMFYFYVATIQASFRLMEKT
jgi:hypothetical protein